MNKYFHMTVEQSLHICCIHVEMLNLITIIFCLREWSQINILYNGWKYISKLLAYCWKLHLVRKIKCFYWFTPYVISPEIRNTKIHLLLTLLEDNMVWMTQRFLVLWVAIIFHYSLEKQIYDFIQISKMEYYDPEHYLAVRTL